MVAVWRGGWDLRFFNVIERTLSWMNSSFVGAILENILC